MLFPWSLLGLLFLIPFVDPRRPLRLLHLDLIVLGAVGAYPMRAYLSGVKPSGAVAVSVLGLAYIAGRLLWMGLRPRRRPEPLVPVVPAAWLAVGLVLLLGFRIGYVLEQHELVRDVGLSSVVGADRIGKGLDVYDDQARDVVPHGDTYGPVSYLAYVPFEQAVPWGGGLFTPRYDDPDAARLAAIVFDLLTVLALLLLGRRMRPGPEGRLLGVALAVAWAAYPYTLLVLDFSLNDALVALSVAGALLALPWAVGRGALAAVAAATKFAPAIAAPVFLIGRERRSKPALLAGAAFVAVSLALFLPLVPDGGLGELYDRTLGFQGGREGANTVWTEFRGLNSVQGLAQAGVVMLAVVLAALPGRRSDAQVAALAGGLLVTAELTVSYWSPAYLVWFAPLAFAALFGTYDCRPAPASSRERARVGAGA